MDDSIQPPSVDRFETLLEHGSSEDAVARLEELHGADTETRKTAIRTLRQLAEARPSLLEPVLSVLAAFLTDERRSIRLTTVKLYVAVAEASPDAVSPVVPSLADRLADDDEFYYVRARAAEALGYVALEYPEIAATPEVLADLRIGLTFDEPEVREKLAKALEYIALGDQDRLSHHVGDLARRLDDPNELVRYHLCTAIVAVGCTYPDALSGSIDALADRLNDESPFVRGRALEAMGILDHSDLDVSIPEGRALVDDDSTQFLLDRVRFATGDTCEETGDGTAVEIGTVRSIRDRTDDVVRELVTADGEVCKHCGVSFPSAGPPICPRCGGPR
ncbi:hypothetical protein HALLA_04060 (plasmid) [Halostagnicola larsenii XH-48]|uniref:HEAT domain-containing protein n=1 Tax=Halostagnicola larsenii XH-48 TaxID=797299 RepID=W0JSJ7_9EURY|nr:sister chromatid cohesion protein PDS5 [Halostagnicola larsenii]AHG01579.1 hypothetical protein HALLA_04060 [Halostagnicola larsenii XH-48]